MKKERCPECKTTNVGVFHCSDTERTIHCRQVTRPFCSAYTTKDDGKTWEKVNSDYECEKDDN